jgi:hypothetical protein
MFHIEGSIQLCISFKAIVFFFLQLGQLYN